MHKGTAKLKKFRVAHKRVRRDARKGIAVTVRESKGLPMTLQGQCKKIASANRDSSIVFVVIKQHLCVTTRPPIVVLHTILIIYVRCVEKNVIRLLQVKDLATNSVQDSTNP